MRTKILSVINKVPMPIWYIAVAAFVATNYAANRETMLSQSAWLTVIKTGATANFLLFSLVYWKILDIFIRRLGYKVNSLRGVAIWLAGIILLVLVMRLAGGFVTIFD